MDKQQVIDTIEATKIVAILRSDAPDHLVEVVRAMMAGGIRVAEITMTVPGALDVIRAVDREFAGTDLLLGAGTVMNREMAAAAIDAGARFMVAPNLNPDMVAFCNERQVAVAPGALTPTEVQAAHDCGADLIKIFPANIGGPKYLRDLLGPLPHVKLMVTGGVNAETAKPFVDAGAVACGVGGALFSKSMLADRDWPQITENARQLVAAVEH